jgi:transmembrane sensor
MSEAADSIAGTASAWHVASVSDAMDWDGFIAWLEADARHAAAFDEVAMADALIETHRISLRKGDVISAYGRQPKVATRSRLWLRWGGTAFAAALIAMVAVPQFRQKAPVEYTTADAARSIALNEGSTIHLAPHSRLTVAGRRDEQITLTGGAWFDVHHDPERRMTIAAGEVTISDIGTSFDIQTAGDRVRVAVATGRVAVSAPALDSSITLAEGRTLFFDRSAGSVRTSEVAREDVGAWRAGRLSYAAAPLSLVADDLARYAGLTVTVAPAIRDREFSGTLAFGNGNTALRDLTQLMGLSLRREPDGAYRVDRSR